MKKIILSLAIIAIATAGVVTATRAYFTSTVTSTANTIATGTLHVAANNSGSGSTFDIDLGSLKNLAPGETSGVATIIVQNDGTINAATFGRFTLSDMGTGSLANVIDFYNYKVEFYKADGTKLSRVDEFVINGVKQGAFNTQGSINLLGWVKGNGPLDIPGAAWDEEALKPAAYYKLTFQFIMNPIADNSYMNKTLGLGYEVKSTQINKDAILNLTLGGNMGDAGVAESTVTYFNTQISQQ